MKFTKNLNALSEIELYQYQVYLKIEWIAYEAFREKPFKNLKI